MKKSQDKYSDLQEVSLIVMVALKNLASTSEVLATFADIKKWLMKRARNSMIRAERIA